jgi:uncharacterized protein YndB with AHSA1/START domain
MDIVHRVGIKAPPAKVYAALSTIDGLSGWWTRETTGQSKVGDVIKFFFHKPDGSELGGFDMDVRELVPHKRISWRVKEGPPEWVGTDIDFTLSQNEDYTIVLFGQRNWREWAEFMSHCSTKWATFLVSLRDYVETGKGKPSPNDVPIGDWH